MAQNREKALKDAERLLKQGKVQPALKSLRQVADKASRDPAVLNRIGDILSMHGRLPEALVYYQKIAEQFAQSGFYPKAIAIYKKILRKDPERVETLIQMGDLYLRQKLPGEARGYLVRAGDQLVQEKEYAQAREVYQILANAEPTDPIHRVRLAETLAAEGEAERAGEELIALTEKMRSPEMAEQLEQVCRRAAELLPGRLEPVLGLIRSLATRGQRQKAIEFAREKVEQVGADPELCGELAILHEEEGGTEEALELLDTTKIHAIPMDVFERFFRSRIDAGSAQEAWDRLDFRFREWKERHGQANLATLYQRVADLEEEGHVPALERLAALHEERDDLGARLPVLERLARAYRGGSRPAEAKKIEEELEKLRPGGDVEPTGPEEKSAPAAAEPAHETPAEEEGTAVQDEASIPLELEAPAVPLNRSDEEFVSGRMTQAEILEKYGLVPKAIGQLKEVAGRFPGHVEVHERLSRLLRQEGQTGPLKDVLVGLAVARRAAGDLDGARGAIKQAREIATLDPDTAASLAHLGLLDDVRQATESAGEPPTPPVEKPAGVDETGDLEPPVAEAPEEEIVIDFDGDAEEPEPASSPVKPPEPEPVPAEASQGQEPQAVQPDKVVAGSEPAQEDLEEVRFFLEHGMREEAAARIEGLREHGFGGGELDRLEASLAEPVAQKQGPATPDDDDLSALTAALESEIFLDEEEPAVPEAGEEQTLEEVFAAFKDHVKEEIESDDFQTHYDLGIAYMEMGLIEEAIAEFENASRDGTIRRESCIMMAMCHRQNGGLPEAVACYQRALETPGEDSEADSCLRYDLAEVLLQQGDLDGALNLFRDVLRADPTYRDVQVRVNELESRGSS